MATFSIFGSASPTIGLNENDSNAYDLGMAFYPAAGATGWSATGARVFIPAGSTAPTTGYVATLWQGQDGPTAIKMATANFGTVTVGAWNEVLFPVAQAVTLGNYYWISVYFPAGKYGSTPNKFTSPIQAVGGEPLYAAGNAEVTPGNGAFRSGAPAGSALTSTNASAWYGVDVILDTGASASGLDSVGITDSVTAERGGLAGSTTLTASATDNLNATANASITVTNSGTVARTIHRSLLGQRLNWGSVLSADQGPQFASDIAAFELAACFTLQWPVRLTKVRIYKAPDLAGTIPITVWAPDGSVMTSTTVTWTADTGGWREITLPAAVALDAGPEYRVSYNAVNFQFAYSPWIFNGQDFIEPPFNVPMFKENSLGKFDAMAFAPGHVAPTQRTASNYYIDPIVEWDSDLPGNGPGYGNQFVNYTPAQAFPVGVFYCDPEWIADYLAMGINTLMGIPTDVPGYREAIVGTTADVWAVAGSVPSLMADAAYADRVQGYFLWDEPDMTHNYASPQSLRDLVATTRRMDSTRPIMLNVGKPSAINQGWQAAPVGAGPDVLNANFIQYAALCDFFSCDFYNMTDDAHENRYGIWTYPVITARMKSISVGRVPVFGYVETTSPTPGQPTPDQVYKATWAHLIAGADGIIYFDHRFGSALVTQDFAAMLHDAPLKTKVTALITDIQALAVPLKDADRGLVTACTSSNTTSGPKGGMFGVPIHYTSRRGGTKTYLFTQAIRPGATTGTFTVPSAAGKTITVRGENRTLTADGSGVFSDSYAADYTVHLYEWTT
ncbi:MAG TPA: DUF4082 domain-containing protein [Arthrobacter sp.]